MSFSSYLNTLELGTHTLTIGFGGTVADVVETFNVVAAGAGDEGNGGQGNGSGNGSGAAAGTTPATGDNPTLILLAALLAAVGVLVCGVALCSRNPRKRMQHSK